MTDALLATPLATVLHADWRAALDAWPRRDDGTVCDLLCVDAPYSERTHSGHDAATRSDGQVPIDIAYDAWTPDDVREYVAAHAPVTRGWMVSITDHVLAPVWSEAMEADGRLAFPPQPLVVWGSTVRFCGGGPNSITCQVVVSRPRTEEFARGPSLPGAYVGKRRSGGIVGGKPLWAMMGLVRDYSRHGDVVLDDCCGAGTTGLAAVTQGRRALLADVDAAHARMAASSLASAREQLTLAMVEP